MKLYAPLPLVLLAIAVSCSTNGKSADSAANEAADGNAKTETAISGQWYLENIVFSDSSYVRPSDEVPGSRQYISFNDDHTFAIMTNCNSISGSYSVTADSIKFDSVMMTEMACDNMATEDALRKILPEITTLEVENDSVVRLNTSEPSAYMILLKAGEIK